MPEPEVEGVGTFDVEDGRRLVPAIEEDTKVRVSMTMSGTGANTAGGKPEEEIAPEPEWIERPY